MRPFMRLISSDNTLKGFFMLTGISTKLEVLQFFTKWLEKEYLPLSDDDLLLHNLMIASADDLITDDTDYWANQSVKVLYQAAKNKLLGV